MKHHIESYSFGRMEVDGEKFTNDLILLPDRIVDNWWRDEGHLLQPEDLDDVIEADPDVLVVGQGAHGRMKISEETRDLLSEQGIELRADTTTEIWKEANELGENTAAAFHLTC